MEASTSESELELFGSLILAIQCVESENLIAKTTLKYPLANLVESIEQVSPPSRDLRFRKPRDFRSMEARISNARVQREEKLAVRTTCSMLLE
jgi:hypothetical protein